MENFKLFSYGFIHFENEHYREVFFNKVKGLRINLDKEKKVVVKFQPVKRKFDHHSNKHVCNLIIFKKYRSIIKLLLLKYLLTYRIPLGGHAMIYLIIGNVLVLIYKL
jgi:hypothetical protein